MKAALGSLVLWVTLGGWSATLSAEPPADAKPGPLQNAEVLWPASITNGWPDKLWVYKVVPQEFSQAVVSNLLTIFQFTPADEIEAREYKAHNDRNAAVFGSLEPWHRHLIICPTLGCIKYFDPKAAAQSHLETVVGVPGQKEVTERGLKLLRQLGIDVSQLATKPGSSDLALRWGTQTIGYNDEKTGKEVTLTNVFGVSFLRHVDGLSLVGNGFHGGVSIDFGNNAKIYDLQLTWRNLQPWQLHDCASPEQIAQWLRSGRFAFHFDKGRLPAPPLKFTIYNADIRYDGRPGDRPMDYVYPLAILEATVAGPAGTNTLWFNAPLTTSEPNWRVLR